jgi:hypothetical protein
MFGNLRNLSQEFYEYNSKLEVNFIDNTDKMSCSNHTVGKSIRISDTFFVAILWVINNLNIQIKYVLGSLIYLFYFLVSRGYSTQNQISRLQNVS